MKRDAERSYPPLDTLKPIADDAWIVDGPVIGFGLPWPKMPFPTRMTILRIGDDLFGAAIAWQRGSRRGGPARMAHRDNDTGCTHWVLVQPHAL
jgi:hypothetical protein